MDVDGKKLKKKENNKTNLVRFVKLKSKAIWS